MDTAGKKNTSESKMSQIDRPVQGLTREASGRCLLVLRLGPVCSLTLST